MGISYTKAIFRDKAPKVSGRELYHRLQADFSTTMRRSANEVLEPRNHTSLDYLDYMEK